MTNSGKYWKVTNTFLRRATGQPLEPSTAFQGPHFGEEPSITGNALVDNGHGSVTVQEMLERLRFLRFLTELQELKTWSETDFVDMQSLFGPLLDSFGCPESEPTTKQDAASWKSCPSKTTSASDSERSAGPTATSSPRTYSTKSSESLHTTTETKMKDGSQARAVTSRSRWFCLRW